MKLGRVRPPPGAKKLKLHEYRNVSCLPTPPASVDYSPRAGAALSQVYGNDRLGDCVIAGGYHILGTLTGNTGSPFIATEAQIEAEYGIVGGYVPGDPSTDNGCDEITALNRWSSAGFSTGQKLDAWATLNAGDPAAVKEAIYLFETALLGVDLPAAWITPFPSANGFVWDVAGDPVPSNGHCIMAVGYDSTGIVVDSWGLIGHVTWAALAKYMTAAAGGELYAVISSLEAVNDKAPNGFDFEALKADFKEVQGG